MKFNQLTPEGEALLKEILKMNEWDYKKKEEYWELIFEKLTDNQDARLRSIFKELKDNGLIVTRWADNIPIDIDISNYGYTYFERKKKHIKKEKRLSRREWKISIISAIIGGIVGLIPYIIKVFL